MKAYALIFPPMLALGACDTPEQTVAAGAATGAVIGGEGDYIEGAIIGAAAGAAYEYLRRKEDDPNNCVYRNVSTGETFVAKCV